MTALGVMVAIPAVFWNIWCLFTGNIPAGHRYDFLASGALVLLSIVSYFAVKAAFGTRHSNAFEFFIEVVFLFLLVGAVAALIYLPTPARGWWAIFHYGACLLPVVMLAVCILDMRAPLKQKLEFIWTADFVRLALYGVYGTLGGFVLMRGVLHGLAGALGPWVLFLFTGLVVGYGYAGLSKLGKKRVRPVAAR